MKSVLDIWGQAAFPWKHVYMGSWVRQAREQRSVALEPWARFCIRAQAQAFLCTWGNKPAFSDRTVSDHCECAGEK